MVYPNVLETPDTIIHNSSSGAITICQNPANISDVTSHISTNNKLSNDQREVKKLEIALEVLYDRLEVPEKYMRDLKYPVVDSVRNHIGNHKAMMEIIEQNERSIAFMSGINGESMPKRSFDYVGFNMTLEKIKKRHGAVKDNAIAHMKYLESAADIVEVTVGELERLTNWLGSFQQILVSNEYTPFDEDELKESIRKQKLRHEEFLLIEPDVVDLVTSLGTIVELFGQSESDPISLQVKHVADRYEMIRDESNRWSALLKETKQELCLHELNVQDLVEWCRTQETCLDRCRIRNPLEVVDMMKCIKNLRSVDDIETITARFRSSGQKLLNKANDRSAFNAKFTDMLMRCDKIHMAVEKTLSAMENVLAQVQKFLVAHNSFVDEMNEFEIHVSGSVNESNVMELEKKLAAVHERLEEMRSLKNELFQMSAYNDGSAADKIVEESTERLNAFRSELNKISSDFIKCRERTQHIVGRLDDISRIIYDSEAKLNDKTVASMQPEDIERRLEIHQTFAVDLLMQGKRLDEIDSEIKAYTAKLNKSDHTFIVLTAKLEALKSLTEVVTDKCRKRREFLDLTKRFADIVQQLEKSLSKLEIDVFRFVARHQSENLQRSDVESETKKPYTDCKSNIANLTQISQDAKRLVDANEVSGHCQVVDTFQRRFGSVRGRLKEVIHYLKARDLTITEIVGPITVIRVALETLRRRIGNVGAVSARVEIIVIQDQEICAVAEELELIKPKYEAIESRETGSDANVEAALEPHLLKLRKSWASRNSEVSRYEGKLKAVRDAAENFWGPLETVLSKCKNLTGKLPQQNPSETTITDINGLQKGLKMIGTEIQENETAIGNLNRSSVKLLSETDNPYDRNGIANVMTHLHQVHTNLASRYVHWKEFVCKMRKEKSQQGTRMAVESGEEQRQVVTSFEREVESPPNKRQRIVASPKSPK